jgi:predicted protein tyrosine phosphatase
MLLVSSLEGAALAYRDFRPASVISLLSEEENLPAFEGLAAGRHLRLYVERESCHQSISRAARDRAAAIIGFGQSWNPADHVLIHCKRGISRSTAAAFILLCMKESATDEALLLARLRRAAPHADPCPLLVNYADEILGRDGRMSDALADLAAPRTALSAPTVEIAIAA